MTDRRSTVARTLELVEHPSPSPADRLFGPERAAEERAAAVRIAAIDAGRRRGGLAGAALAGSMLALRDIVEGPPREEIPIEVEVPGEPHDVDRDGLTVEVEGGVAVHAPPLPPLPRHG